MEQYNKGQKREGDESCEMQRKKRAKTEDKGLFSYMHEIPTLQRIASVSVAIHLWTRPNALELFQELHYAISNGFQRIEYNVEQNLTDMLYPGSLKIKLSDFINPIGLEFVRCEKMLMSEFDLCSYWTMHGTIDVGKLLSAKYYQNRNVDNEFFHKVCDYCLVDCISDVWVNMCENRKEACVKYCFSGDSERHLVAYWVSVLRNELPNFLSRIELFDTDDIYDLNCSVYQNMVSLSIYIGNAVSMKYFWYKLTEREKLDNIKKWLLSAVELFSDPFLDRIDGTGYIGRVDIFCFLLPHLRDPNELKEMFQAHSLKILLYLLSSWPHHQFFLPTIGALMAFDYIPFSDYVTLFRCIVSKEILTKIGSISSMRYKRELFSSDLQRIDLSLLMRDIEEFQTILNDSSSVEKKKIILNICRNMKRWNSLKVFNVLCSTLKSLSSDPEDNLLRLSIVFNDEVVERVIVKAGIQAAERLFSLGFQALNEIQKFEVCKVDELPSVIRLYEVLVIVGNDEHVDQFLNWYFETGEEIIQFKKSYLKKPLNRWFSHWFISDIITESSEIWNRYEKLIRGSFSSPREIASFKKEHIKDVIGLLKWREFELASMFMNWIFNSTEKVCIKRMNVSKLFEALGILGNFDYVEQLLKLYFSTEDEIIKFKKSFFDRPLVRWFSQWKLENIDWDCRERWKVYENLINYNFRTSKEVAQFKEKQAFNAVYFVEQGDYSLASMLLEWCFDSTDAVYRYKMECLMSEKFLTYLSHSVSLPPFSRKIKLMKNFIRWFLPLPTEVEKLKLHLKDDSFFGRLKNVSCEVRDALIYLLDCFDQKRPPLVDLWDDDFGDDGAAENILNRNNWV